MPTATSNTIAQQLQSTPNQTEKPVTIQTPLSSASAKANRPINKNRAQAKAAQRIDTGIKKVIQPTEAEPVKQAPVVGIGLPRVIGGGFGFGQQAFRPVTEPLTAQAYYRQMMAIEARNKQLQLLTAQFHQLSDDWEHPAESFSGKCWVQSASDSVLECDSIELKNVINGRDTDVLAILGNIRSMGVPAEGISVVYHDSRYDISVLATRIH